MLYIFDLDTTLIEPYMKTQGRKFGHLVACPGRREILAYLMMEGHDIAIVTNQAGIAFDKVTEQDLAEKILNICPALGVPGIVPIYMCAHHPKATNERFRDPVELERRMPNPGMIFEAINTFAKDPVECMFICDYGPHKKAGHGAGIETMTWDDFIQKLA